MIDLSVENIEPIVRDAFDSLSFRDEYDTIKIEDTGTHIRIYYSSLRYLNTLGGSTSYIFQINKESGQRDMGRLSVSKPYRNRTFGRQLVSAMEKICLGAGINTIRLDRALETAPRFFENCGYSVVNGEYQKELK